MRTGYLKYAVVLISACGMMTAAATSQAQTGSVLTRPAGISWDQGPEALVVSYRDVWAELANQDPTPLIRIFGDGRVLIHYPVYTPRAGKYDLWLQPAELESLLSLLAKGLATFQPKAVESLKSSEEQRRWEADVPLVMATWVKSGGRKMPLNAQLAKLVPVSDLATMSHEVVRPQGQCRLPARVCSWETVPGCWQEEP